ncbi:MAG: hypothetical protein RRZ24_02810 [Clostridia bacterium]
MAWYWIVAIVIGAFFALTFLMYITNADMKLVEKIYDAIIKHHDSKETKERL